MIALFLIYGWLLAVSISNYFLMRRPTGSALICFEVLIPARNEAENLTLVIPPLVASGVKVTVFNDDSSDDTAKVAESLGANVITSTTPLPAGWTGKNRACHELSAHATAEWAVFLDADTIPNSDFAPKLSAFLASRPDAIKLVTGVPHMLLGEGLEPAYLGWVPWILGASNPFGLVARTQKGHNAFTNGQFGAWRTATLQELQPHELVKGHVLEDINIGRLLAKRKIQVEVANVSDILQVRMYRTLREAIDGMSKNSADVWPGVFGCVCLTLIFILIGLGWTLGGPYRWLLLGMLLTSKFICDRIIRYPIWTLPFMPLTCLAAAATVVRAMIWKRKGRVAWKGRMY
jgi:glycosyltransferase involved in cell wall biosynthesis